MVLIWYPASMQTPSAGLEVKIPCPLSALEAIAAELRKFGVQVVFITPNDGEAISIAGRLEFWHDGETLHVRVLQDLGHFSRSMLIGGMRQLVQEAVEALQGHEIESLTVPAQERAAELG